VERVPNGNNTVILLNEDKQRVNESDTSYSWWILFIGVSISLVVERIELTTMPFVWLFNELRLTTMRFVLLFVPGPPSADFQPSPVDSSILDRFPLPEYQVLCPGIW
jgi:hypothetical protein